MRQVLAILANDLRRLFRSKDTLVWLLLMPLPYTFFMGIAFKERQSPPPVLVLEAAAESPVTAIFDEAYEAEGYDVKRVEPGVANSVRGRLRVKLPAVLEAALVSGEECRILVAYPEGSTRGRSLTALTERILWRIKGRLLAQAVRDGEADPKKLGDDPPAVSVTIVESEWGDRPRIASGFKQAVPGNLVMFVTLTILVTGGIRLIQDREAGLVRRVLTTPVRPRQGVLGRFLGIAATGFVECIYFLLLGRILFGLTLGGSPGVLLAFLGLFSLAMAGLGVLMGCLLRSAKQVGALGVLFSLLLAALGGCWWPIEIVPGWMKTVGLALPTGQAMHAVLRLTVWNDPVTAVAGSFLYMALFGSVTAFLAAWALRRKLS